MLGSKQEKQSAFSKLKKRGAVIATAPRFFVSKIRNQEVQASRPVAASHAHRP
jgi:hypothetical protein